MTAHSFMIPRSQSGSPCQNAARASSTRSIVLPSHTPAESRGRSRRTSMRASKHRRHLDGFGSGSDQRGALVPRCRALCHRWEIRPSAATSSLSSATISARSPNPNTVKPTDLEQNNEVQQVGESRSRARIADRSKESRPASPSTTRGAGRKCRREEVASSRRS